MRSVVAFATSAALAAAVAGCSSLEGTYIREGIGANLSSSDLPEASRLQAIYIGEICRQAGLRVAQRGDVLLCDEIDMKPAEWATFVQAGMNDIDRRCDAYLTWLDNKRRSREPILKQLNTTAAATAAILGLTGAGEVPIAIVAQAFLFAQDSFTNFQSRLITDIDHTVIQSVVLDHQNKFRDKIAAVPVDNRPAAIYLLRNYLRICMPMSIEMSISETVTTFHRGGADALRPDPLLTRPPVVAAHVATAVPLTGRTPLIKTTPGTSTSLSGAVTPGERNMTTDILKKIQALLCVPRDGAFGLKTREGIRMFQSTLGTGAATG